jgi:pyridoxamine 5'-phosphate oxidase
MTDQNPILIFRQWYLEAVDSGIPDPTVMTLATTGSDYRPSARVVLMKSFDERGFVFYSNYCSNKAEDLDSNPFAALVFYWPKLGHQVRIEGRVEKTSSKESDTYFASRPRGSQLGAWASKQSWIIPSGEILEKALWKKEQEFKGKEVPRPPYWGGYRLIPDRMEFWVDRENRLHDRCVYERILGTDKPGSASDKSPDEWIMRRLSP